MNKSSSFNKKNNWPTNTERMVIWFNKIYNHYGAKHTGEMTLMFNKNALHLLFDGKLKETVSIKNLVMIIG